MQPKIVTILEEPKTSEQIKEKEFSVPESLALTDSISVPFESPSVNFTSNLSGQYENIVEQNKKLTPISVVDNVNRKYNLINFILFSNILINWVQSIA